MKFPGFIRKSLTAAFLAAAAVTAVPVAAVAQDYDGVAPIVVSSAPYFYAPGHSLALQSLESVDVRLVLVIDASSSMTPDEYRIQVEAMAQALTSDDVIDAWFGSDPLRRSGPIESIAIAVVDFGQGADLRIPWVDFRADDPDLKERLARYAQQVRTLIRDRDDDKRNSTMIGNMLTYVQDIYRNAPVRSELRDVLDVFSDGKNYGTDLVGPRRELAVMGVTVNALAIVNEVPDLDTYFRENLATQYSDIPSELYGTVVPGRVWAVARNMQGTGNDREVLTSFGRDVELAFRSKIVWETVLREIAPMEGPRPASELVYGAVAPG